MKEKIKNIISFLEAQSEKAQEAKHKWRHTNTTYGDTDRDASDVEFGREIGLEQAINALSNLI